jgi:hypothetical protein
MLVHGLDARFTEDPARASEHIHCVTGANPAGLDWIIITMVLMFLLTSGFSLLDGAKISTIRVSVSAVGTRRACGC